MKLLRVSPRYLMKNKKNVDKGYELDFDIYFRLIIYHNFIFSNVFLNVYKIPQKCQKI